MELSNTYDDVEAAGVETTANPATVVSFDGPRGELAGLLFRNLLLTLATLGVYRFWAKTRVRGFLWRHVKLLDDPLEYLGTGTELLVGFLIAVVFIAPLTSAYSCVATTRYFTDNARFGTTRFSFEGRTVRLFLRWLVVMAPTLAAVLLFFLVNDEALAALWRLLRDPTVDGPSIIAAAGRFNGAPLGLVLVSAVLFPWYRVSEFRHLVNAARIGGNRLESRMDAGSVYGVYFMLYLCLFGAALFIVFGVFGLLQVILKESGVTVNPALGFVVGLLVAGSGYWLYGLARTLIVDISLLALACDTLSVQEPEALERTVQSTDSLPGHGEGLADALDVGGF